MCWVRKIALDTLIESLLKGFPRSTSSYANSLCNTKNGFCFNSMIAIRDPVLTNRRCYRHTVNKPPPGLLQFKTMSKRFPWHLIVLLGSGFALAEACKVTIYTGPQSEREVTYNEWSYPRHDVQTEFLAKNQTSELTTNYRQNFFFDSILMFN